jgi:hypothetical protein
MGLITYLYIIKAIFKLDLRNYEVACVIKIWIYNECLIDYGEEWIFDM